MNQQQLQDIAFLHKMIELTSYDQWDEFKQDLRNEIYQWQANLLDDAKNWDQVCFAKGWCAALAYVGTLRERSEASLAQYEDKDAHL